MKHRFIVITLLVTVFLSGCGGIATEVTTPIEEQVSSSINKVDPDTATSLAVSYYETIYGGKGIEFTYLEPTVEKLSKNEYRISFYVDAYCALPASPKNNETRYVECVATTENIMLGWSYETEMGLNEGFTGRPVFIRLKSIGTELTLVILMHRKNSPNLHKSQNYLPTHQKRNSLMISIQMVITPPMGDTSALKRTLL